MVARLHNVKHAVVLYQACVLTVCTIDNKYDPIASFCARTHLLSRVSYSRYLLEEDLLELPQARLELGLSLTVPQDLLGLDEFENFPSAVRPRNLCTIVGGIGARSFLHWSAPIPSMHTPYCSSYYCNSHGIYCRQEITIPPDRLWRGEATCQNCEPHTSVDKLRCCSKHTLRCVPDIPYVASGEPISAADTYVIVQVCPDHRV